MIPTLYRPGDGDLAAGDLALAEGSIVRGNSSGIGAAHSAKTSGQILVGDGTTVASVAVSGDATLSSAGALSLAAQILNGAEVADTADANVIGGIPVVFRINTTSGATNTVNVVTTHKIRVIDVWCLCTSAGSAAATIQVLSTGSAITDAIDVNDADTTISRAATIDDANHEIAAGGTLRVTMTDAGSDGPAVTTYVLALRVA